MSEIVKRFKVHARILAGDHCQCGQYEPVRTQMIPGATMLYYGPAGTTPAIPEQKHCVHRRIEMALIKAYRTGRAA
jgi:hypothetical protein